MRKVSVKNDDICIMPTANTLTNKVNHGDLRDDRPSHGRDVRASKDGLAACRRASAMASLYTEFTKPPQLFFTLSPSHCVIGGSVLVSWGDLSCWPESKISGLLALPHL
jgi:hypothetical protein